MSYQLEPHFTHQDSRTIYQFSDKPVGLSLIGPHSYCILKGISNEKLKESLSKVGVTYEKTLDTFFNVLYFFTPIEANEEYQENGDLVKDIFGFVNEAINEQTNGKLNLELTGMTQLDFDKTEDRSYLSPQRAYRLAIRLTESAVEKAEKAGLVFREYTGNMNIEEFF